MDTQDARAHYTVHDVIDRAARTFGEKFLGLSLGKAQRTKAVEREDTTDTWRGLPLTSNRKIWFWHTTANRELPRREQYSAIAICYAGIEVMRTEATPTIMQNCEGEVESIDIKCGGSSDSIGNWYGDDHDLDSRMPELYQASDSVLTSVTHPLSTNRWISALAHHICVAYDTMRPERESWLNPTEVGEDVTPLYPWDLEELEATANELDRYAQGGGVREGENC